MYAYTYICFPIVKWLTRYIDRHWCWVVVTIVGRKNGSFCFTMTKWLSTGTIINTLNNSHRSKMIRIFNIDLNHSIFFHICESRCNPWCDTYNSARCRTQEKERESECVLYRHHSFSIWDVLSFSLSLFLYVQLLYVRSSCQTGMK